MKIRQGLASDFSTMELGKRISFSVPCSSHTNHVFKPHGYSSLTMGRWHPCGCKSGSMVGKKYALESSADMGPDSIHSAPTPPPQFPAAPHIRRRKVQSLFTGSSLRC